MMEVVVCIFCNEGVGVFYKGIGVIVVRIMLGFFVLFVVFEVVVLMFENEI